MAPQSIQRGKWKPTHISELNLRASVIYICRPCKCLVEKPLLKHIAPLMPFLEQLPQKQTNKNSTDFWQLLTLTIIVHSLGNIFLRLSHNYFFFFFNILAQTTNHKYCIYADFSNTLFYTYLILWNNSQELWDHIMVIRFTKTIGGDLVFVLCFINYSSLLASQAVKHMTRMGVRRTRCYVKPFCL